MSSSRASETIAGPVAPGASVSATFTITSGAAAFNGDLVGRASWKDVASGVTRSETTAQKVRNVGPIKINEFRISDGSPANSTNSFVELYNGGATELDISNWTLTQHQTQQAIFSTVQIPPGRKLPAGGFYLVARTGNSDFATHTPTPHASPACVVFRPSDGAPLLAFVAKDDAGGADVTGLMKLWSFDPGSKTVALTWTFAHRYKDMTIVAGNVRPSWLANSVAT